MRRYRVYTMKRKTKYDESVGTTSSTERKNLTTVVADRFQIGKNLNFYTTTPGFFRDTERQVAFFFGNDYTVEEI